MIDLTRFMEIETLLSMGTNAQVVTYSPQGEVLVSGGRDGAIRVWSCAERRLLRQLNDHEGAVIGLHFRADGARLLSFDARGKAIWWDATTWQKCQSFTLESQTVSAAVSPDGHLIVTGVVGGLHWINGETGELLATRLADC